VISHPSQFNRVPHDLNGAKAVPLVMNTDTMFSHEHLYDNCHAALASGFPILQEAGKIRMQPICLVGASPNLGNHLHELARRKAAGAHVMAIKGAHDYLISKGIIPDSAVAADAQADRARIFRDKREGTTYFLATQMHPDTWDYMRGSNVILWHPRIDKHQDTSPEWKGVKKVYGGNTTGLRAISLAWILGYRIVTLFGFESCVRDHGKRYKVTGEGTPDYDPPFPVNYAGRWFMSNASLAQQCVDLMPTLQMCPGIKLDTVGDGALPWVLSQGKAAGWPV